MYQINNKSLIFKVPTFLIVDVKYALIDLGISRTNYINYKIQKKCYGEKY